MHELVYISSPSRLIHKKDEMMQLVASHGKGGLHPFNALPYEYFEGGVVGRDTSMRYCCSLIDVCHEFWLFGISEGTLIETEYFMVKNREDNVKPFIILVKEFDPEWQKYYDIFIPRFSRVLQSLGLK